MLAGYDRLDLEVHGKSLWENVTCCQFDGLLEEVVFEDDEAAVDGVGVLENVAKLRING